MFRLLFGLGLLWSQCAMAQEDYPQLQASSSGVVEAAVGEAVPIRRARVDRETALIAREAWPAFLSADGSPSQMRAALRVSVAPDGEPTFCSVESIVWPLPDGSGRHDEDIDSPLALQMCAIASGQLRYRHAIDASGAPVSDEIPVVLRYSREAPRVARIMAPPDSRARSVDGWPPPVQLLGRARGKEFSVPDGAAYVAEEFAVAGPVEVDVILRTDAEGSVTECTVAVPSALQAYDAASCPALASLRQIEDLYAFPLRLVWTGQDIAFVMPRDTRGPVLAEPVELLRDMTSGLTVPDDARVAVRLYSMPDGALERCAIIRPSFDDALDALSCQVYAGKRLRPALGPFGEPVHGELDIDLDWRTLTTSGSGR